METTMKTFFSKQTVRESARVFRRGHLRRQRVGSTAFLAVFTGLAVAQAKLNVVCTTADLASLAREVGGDRIELTTLARPTEDPHFVDPKPSFIVKLNHADALIHGGAELESAWLSPLVEQARNARIVSAARGNVRCCEGVQLLEVPATLDRSKGDIHALGNPHYLTDPENAKIVAHHIAEAFGELDPPNREFYAENARRFIAALDAKLVEWKRKLAPFQGRHLVAYHNSWPYFAARFGLKIELFLEPKPGIPPSPSHLATVMAQMKERGARVILVEPYLNRRTAEKVAAETGAVVLELTQFPGGVKGTEGGYIALMDYLVNALAQALDTTK
jgi:zinc/manganese transport system substrate-binding protein